MFYHLSLTQRQWFFLFNSFRSFLCSTLRSSRLHSLCSATGGTRFLEIDWQCCWKFNFHFCHQNFNFGSRFTQLSFHHHDIREQMMGTECCVKLVLFNFCLSTDDDFKDAQPCPPCASEWISSKFSYFVCDDEPKEYKNCDTTILKNSSMWAQLSLSLGRLISSI